MILAPEGVRLPGVRPVPPDVIDLEKALLSVSMLPVMVTPIVDPVVGFPGAPSSYPEPPLPVMLNNDPDPMGEIDWEHPGIHRGNLITCAGSERVTDRVCSIK